MILRNATKPKSGMSSTSTKHDDGWSFTASTQEFLHSCQKLSIRKCGRRHTYQYKSSQCENILVPLIQTSSWPYNTRHSKKNALEEFPLHAVSIMDCTCALKPASIEDRIIRRPDVSSWQNVATYFFRLLQPLSTVQSTCNGKQGSYHCVVPLSQPNHII